MKRLATSVSMNKFHPSLFSLHRKAVSDRRGCVMSRTDPLNKGGSEVDHVTCDENTEQKRDVTKAVTVDDLVTHLPIKKLNVSSFSRMF